MNICDKSKCTGCLACMNICPKGAIAQIEDEFGCLYPQIDKTKCIDCDLCKRICPSNTQSKYNLSDCAYAVYSEDDTDKKYSSSGGVAAVLARYITNIGGSVWGAACSDKITKHICAERVEDIEKLRGSKYVQSYMGDSYKDIKRQLEGGQKVVFIGTPCQVAGLNSFLGKDFENLITVDLICHGTPPHKYLKEHIDYVVKGKQWDSYAFRGKHDFKLSVYDGENIVYIKDRLQDEYFYSFLQGLTYRESCYSCKYARTDRVSDITLGDFWGLDRKSLSKKYDGRISVVLTNTDKGKALFDEIKDCVVWEKREFSEAANKEQGNLLKPSKKHKETGAFRDNYKKYGFTRSVRKTSLNKLISKEKIKCKLRSNKMVGVVLKLRRKLLK